MPVRSGCKESLSNTDYSEVRTIALNDGDSEWVYAVAFQPDGEYLLGGGSEEVIRRWRLADGQEVGKQTGMRATAISVSRDHRWIVCGTFDGVKVWNREMQEKVIDEEGASRVWAVDVSPDSTRFATGTSRKDASIWSITSGKRLVGPLTHDNCVNGIRFSPTGEHVATACWSNSIRIFNSHTGVNLVTISTDIPGWGPATPIAWSSDAQQIFSACRDNKIRAFDASTGSLLAQSHSLCDGSNDVAPIAVAANGKFIAAFAEHSISFLDTSILAQIGPVIEDGKRLGSIAISADSSYLATGRADGKIMIRDLSKILPASYGPFHVSISAFIILAWWIITPIPSR
ncbi:WD40-repeat-containing domain protein [Butyriboletus roseoflavus]|nr:WD40-repeat-containing domain protein [Butyriboletus roseoflavus]